jgi:hypothetical protein
MTAAPSLQDHMSPAARASNPGVPITLEDGSLVTLRYTMRSLAEIEDRVCPLGQIQDVLGSGDQPLIRPLTSLISAGCGHSPEQLLDLLDVTRLNEYTAAIALSLEMALPKPDPQGPQDARINGSPGATSSSSRRGTGSGSASSGKT